MAEIIEIEFDGTVKELREKLEELEDDGKGGFWIEHGPYNLDSCQDDHTMWQTVSVDPDNERVFLGS